MNTLSRQPRLDIDPVNVSTDIVIFTIREDSLQVLLRQRQDRKWALPGGYVEASEDVGDCAARTLAAQTGLRDIYLEQLYTFGRPDRHPIHRVVTVAYYALAPLDRLPSAAMMRSPPVAWHTMEALPDLYLDHGEIVSLAHQRLSAKLDYSTIAFQFMPESFTLGELQKVYEIIRGDLLDKRNFRKRILALDCVEFTGATRRNTSHRPARLYRYRSPGRVHYLK